jgi:hypothetical protein
MRRGAVPIGVYQIEIRQRRQNRGGKDQSAVGTRLGGPDDGEASEGMANRARHRRDYHRRFRDPFLNEAKVPCVVTDLITDISGASFTLLRLTFASAHI